MSSPQRGFAPATIAYKAIILTAITMGAMDKAGEVCVVRFRSVTDSHSPFTFLTLS